MWTWRAFLIPLGLPAPRRRVKPAVWRGATGTPHPFWLTLRLSLLGTGALLIMVAIATWALHQGAGTVDALLATIIGALLAISMLMTLMACRIKRLLHDPLTHLRAWAIRMRAGDLSARIPEDSGGELAELARDINRMSAELEKLTQEMDHHVQEQTEWLAQKTRSLQILYDVAASLNSSYGLDDLLTRFLFIMTEIVDARAGVVRLLTPDGHMRIVASKGMDEELLEKERFMPSDCMACGSALAQGVIVSQQDLVPCSRKVDHRFFGEGVEMVVVPLLYRGKNLGVYNLFSREPGLAARDDVRDLLTSLGRHLGMAVEKTRLDMESQRLTLLQERAMLAHELHDSLAQSLASLRIQVQMLSETLQQDQPVRWRGAQHEVGQIKKGLDEAYAELRQLLVHFRTRVDERGLVPALEDMLARLGRETGITVFLQQESRGFVLPPEYEIQVLHIVQEALTNVRKYSRARHVRVLLRNSEGEYYVLVEDDGLGIALPPGEPLPGERIGMTVMRERAGHLGGSLTIESEPGEGTRVGLTFHYRRAPPPRAAAGRR